MKEKGILIRADYGHIALHLREIMEERGGMKEPISWQKKMYRVIILWSV